MYDSMGVPRDQKRVSDLLKLALQTMVSHHVGPENLTMPPSSPEEQPVLLTAELSLQLTLLYFVSLLLVFEIGYHIAQAGLRLAL